MTIQKPITIIEREQSIAAWTRSVRIGKKSFETPGHFLMLERPSEVTILCMGAESDPQGLVVSLADAYLLPKVTTTQVTLDPTKAAHLTEYEAIRHNLPVIFEPMSAFMCGGPQEKKAAYGELPQLPSDLAKAFKEWTTNDHNAKWGERHRKDKALPWLLRVAQMQNLADADLILPLAAHIDGTNQGMAQIAVDCNETTAELVAKEDWAAECGMYFSIHPRAFPDEVIRAIVLNAIEDRMRSKRPPPVVFLRIADYDDNDAMVNMGARAFFERLNGLKTLAQLEGNPFLLVVATDTGRGPALVFAGADAFVEPYHKTGFARSQGGRIPQHGGYYHPGEGFDVFVPHEHMLKVYEKLGKRLPCECTACGQYAGIGLPKDPEEWNRFRRTHFVNVRQAQLRQMREAINEGNAREAMMRLTLSNNPQFLTWLPLDYR